MVSGDEYLRFFGRYAVYVPRDLVGNLRWRRRMMGLSGEERGLVMECCRRDLMFWLDSFVWQYNPNAIGMWSLEDGPWVSYDYQRRAFYEVLRAMQDRKDLLIEKSRELGASWMCMLVMVWFFLFWPRKAFLVISRNADAVDRSGDPNCLWAKVEFVLRWLPDWMVGQDRGKMRRKMAWVNHLNGSTITGEASTQRSGVGSRAFAMFIDEFSQIPEAEEVYARTSNTTKCRIFNGTHKGTGTRFYKLAMGGECRKVVMHWTEHPDKRWGMYRWNVDRQRVEYWDEERGGWCDHPVVQYPDGYEVVRGGGPSGGYAPHVRSPWYDEEVKRKPDERSVAEDLDIDPHGSSRHFFNHEILRELMAQYACPPYWEGQLTYTEEGRFLGVVPERGGRLRLWTHLLDGERVRASRYIVGVDCASGAGGEMSTASSVAVLDAKTGEMVAEYLDASIEPHELAVLVVAMCWMFGDGMGGGAKLIWELNGPGMSFGREVERLGYRHVYRRDKTRKKNGMVASEMGWRSDEKSKRMLLDHLKRGFYERLLVCRSRRVYEEALRFEYVAGTAGRVEHPLQRQRDDPSGAGVNHGDMCIAFALAWWVAEEDIGLQTAHGPQRLISSTPLTSNSLLGRMQMTNWQGVPPLLRRRLLGYHAVHHEPK